MAAGLLQPVRRTQQVLIIISNFLAAYFNGEIIKRRLFKGSVFFVGEDNFGPGFVQAQATAIVYGYGRGILPPKPHILDRSLKNKVAPLIVERQPRSLGNKGGIFVADGL